MVQTTQVPYKSSLTWHIPQHENNVAHGSGSLRSKVALEVACTEALQDRASNLYFELTFRSVSFTKASVTIGKVFRKDEIMHQDT